MLFIILLALSNLVVVNGDVIQRYLPRPLSSGAFINVSYKCHLNAQEPYHTQQMWFLQGGPGGSGYDVFENITATFLIKDPKGIYCITDYRGVYKSSEITCLGDICNTNSNECKDDFERRYNMSDFYTQNAAEDVIALVNLINDEYHPKNVTLYGVSYGTFWLQKIMQINGSVADRWIFDGVVIQPWMDNGNWYNNGAINIRTLQEYLFNCTKNDICKKYFSIDHYYIFLRVLSSLYSTKSEYDIYLKTRNLQDYFERPRIYKNNFVDVVNEALNIIVTESSGLQSLDARQTCTFNIIVYQIVLSNELIGNPYYYLIDNVNFPFNLKGNIINDINWQVDIVRDYRPIVTSGEVLILGGQLDMQTPIINSYKLYDYFIDHGVNAHVLEAKNFGHGVIGQKTSNGSCGTDLVFAFAHDEDFDFSCLNNTNFKDFDTADYSNFTIVSLDDEQPPGTITSYIKDKQLAVIVTESVLIVILFVVSVVLALYAWIVKRRVSHGPVKMPTNNVPMQEFGSV